MKRKACPLCGNRRHAQHAWDHTLLVCQTCFETLFPHELVYWVTRWTRRRYNRTNSPSGY